MNPRIVGLIAAVALVAAIGGSALAAQKKDASSAYVTTDTACEVENLQVNLIEEAGDAFVWLKLGDTTEVGDLNWTLWSGGEDVDSGTFGLVDECDDDKYTLAYPGFPELDDGTYTMEVYFTADGTNFSSDSFRVRD